MQFSLKNANIISLLTDKMLHGWLLCVFVYVQKGRELAGLEHKQKSFQDNAPNPT